MSLNLRHLSSTIGIHFVHMNMHSLKGNYKTFCLEFTLMNMDIISVSETWFKANDALTSFYLNGYTQYTVDRCVCTY